ncbi:MAG: 1,4-dihydroxy-6-naphthoate synthase [Vicinamibacteria bacterium]
MRLSLAYSPCPNDTFMFGALAQRRLSAPDLELEITLDDVEALNQAAFARTHHLTKLSAAAYVQLQDRYQALRVGAALGRGAGPLVVTREPLAREALAGSRVALPGQHTTAHLLFRAWAPPNVEPVHLRYDQIMGAVSAGEVEAGVLIHEGRFVYAQQGLSLLADLGEWWEEDTDLPLPLGLVAARRDLPQRVVTQVEESLRASIVWAQSHREEIFPYLREHAQELAPDVIWRHVDLYVNEQSLGLDAGGEAALERLAALAQHA